MKRSILKKHSSNKNLSIFTGTQMNILPSPRFIFRETPTSERNDHAWMKIYNHHKRSQKSDNYSHLVKNKWFLSPRKIIIERRNPNNENLIKNSSSNTCLKNQNISNKKSINRFLNPRDARKENQLKKLNSQNNHLNSYNMRIKNLKKNNLKAKNNANVNHYSMNRNVFSKITRFKGSHSNLAYANKENRNKYVKYLKSFNRNCNNNIFQKFKMSTQKGEKMVKNINSANIVSKKISYRKVIESKKNQTQLNRILFQDKKKKEESIKCFKTKNSFQSIRYQDLNLKKIIVKKKKSSITSIKPLEDNSKCIKTRSLRHYKSSGSLTIRNFTKGDKKIENLIKGSKIVNIKDLESIITKTENLIKQAKKANLKDPKLKSQLRNEIEESFVKVKKIENQRKKIKKMESFLESFLEMVDNENAERISKLEPKDVSKIMNEHHQTFNVSFLDELNRFNILFQKN
jgi:hypothetical protein